MEKLIGGEIYRAVAEAVSAGELPQRLLAPFNVDINLEPGRGDFSCNAALVNAKTFGMPPRRLAEIIVGRLSGIAVGSPDSLFGKVDIAGAGFINFTVKSDFYNATVEVATTRAAGDTLKLGGAIRGASDSGTDSGGVVGGNKRKRVLIEFVSANPTGPMHIGNARGGALGDTLAELFTFAGYYAEREFYVNDGGNQVKKLGLSLDLRYKQICGGETIHLLKDNAGDGEVVSDGLPEDAYHGEDIVVNARAYYDAFGDKLLSETETVRRDTLAAFALPRNLAGIEADLLKYRVKYDNWFRESEAVPKIPHILDLLDKAGATYEKDGALWFKGIDFGAKFGVQEDFVLVRDNGVPTYITPDIAYHYNKLCEREFDIVVDILGADHHGYSGRMYACMSALSVDVSRLKILLMQMVMLMRDGVAVKLSKRSGKAITLSTLLDEVPIDAARFFFNLKDADTQLNFDLDLAVEESNKNPVYYVQYAHARICSLLKKAAEAGADVDGADVNNTYVYDTPAEQTLIKTLYIFEKTISEAVAAFNPAKVARYALDLASAFHKFYDTCRVSGDGVTAEATAARVALIKAVRATLVSALGILKVDAPERM